MSATTQYIEGLSSLKPGDLGLLRTHAGKGLDETVDGFDLFAGLWWPLRRKNERAPRRQVAWLIAKLYAFRPIENSPGKTLAGQLRHCLPETEKEKERFIQRFDRMLILPLDKIETPLRWALDLTSKSSGKVDWVKLTDDLSSWQKETTRMRWTKQFLATEERK